MNDDITEEKEGRKEVKKERGFKFWLFRKIDWHALITGNPACSLRGSWVPSGWKSQNKTASPAIGGTEILPWSVRGKLVSPPSSGVLRNSEKSKQNYWKYKKEMGKKNAD